MSKYYINQKFSLKDRFAIKDENQIDVFTAEGEFFSLGKKIMLRTMNGEDLLLIKEKVWSLLSRFEFYIGDQLISEMKQEFTLFKKRYNIVMPNWQIEGDIWDFNFDIKENGSPIATIRKKWFSWMDAYEIDVLDEKYTELILGIVIAIDADLEDDNE